MSNIITHVAQHAIIFLDELRVKRHENTAFKQSSSGNIPIHRMMRTKEHELIALFDSEKARAFAEEHSLTLCAGFSFRVVKGIS